MAAMIVDNVKVEFSIHSCYLKCCTIGLGDLKMSMKTFEMTVYLDDDYLKFQVPDFIDRYQIKDLVLNDGGVEKVLANMGEYSSIIAVYPSSPIAEYIKEELNIVDHNALYYDPYCPDKEMRVIVFIMPTVTDPSDVFRLLARCFPTSIQAIGQQEADEIITKYYCRTSYEMFQNATVIVDFIPKEITGTLGAASTPKLRLPFVYAPSKKESITITNTDVLSLDEGSYLSNTMVDFYFKYIFHEKLTKDVREKTYIFNSSFYTCLAGKHINTTLSERVKLKASIAQWVKEVDIFSKDFIVIPIYEKHTWYLAILCYPGIIADDPDSIIISYRSNSQNSSSEQAENTPFLFIYNVHGDFRVSNRIVNDVYHFVEISWKDKSREPHLIRHHDVLELLMHCFRSVADSATRILQMAELFLKYPLQLHGPCRWNKMPGFENECLMQLLHGKKSEIGDVLIRSSSRSRRRT
ncbi:sentrin-specific protease 6 [Caerostris darwini]|uniref:Sentrin-specific protease 6 n=1 Tax=Caerostris darwini TaxID=1538125 RepID=A0AAV4V1F5_9ARAC|nr:sentrin-specific protease 6 [Caerostris darwini]